ncbi:hypothetical protein OH76DRAFT_1051737 [Lentinus brumalis]|uniref:Uncharacterized protein n=1 Tax=Lentinus brumalis TaxID=2498619 RepID=A0A371CWI4_9APHY|nr:hypothetical protein OH76DRAFT_1051737 [Polyporus brumalis]
MTSRFATRDSRWKSPDCVRGRVAPALGTHGVYRARATCMHACVRAQVRTEGAAAGRVRGVFVLRWARIRTSCWRRCSPALTCASPTLLPSSTARPPPTPRPTPPSSAACRHRPSPSSSPTSASASASLSETRRPAASALPTPEVRAAAPRIRSRWHQCELDILLDVNNRKLTSFTGMDSRGYTRPTSAQTARRGE